MSLMIINPPLSENIIDLLTVLLLFSKKVFAHIITSSKVFTEKQLYIF